MRTSAPDHLYLSLGLPHLASLQLLYTLIGRYHTIRRSKHAALIDTHIYPPHLLKHPTRGTCEIALRPSTDPDYEVELIQSTTMTHKTQFDRVALGLEKRCFRIRAGEWSVWMMEEMAPGAYCVGGKVADLVMWEVPRPIATERGELQLVRLSTREGGGVEGDFLMTVWLGERPCWQMKSRVGWRGDGAEVVCDEYWPIGS